MTEYELALQVFDEACRGDFRRIDEVVAHLEASDPVSAPAWTTAFHSARWTAQPIGAQPVSVQDLEVWLSASPSARAAAALTCALGVRWAALAFDPLAVDEWVAMMSRLVQDGDVPNIVSLWFGWARVWQQVASGADVNAVKAASALETAASSAQHAPLVVEAAALRALSVLEGGDLEEATASARRASRMARTEALPQQEYLAHLVLARVRRMIGHPHLATRILSALLRVAPATWHPWIRWELHMAGAAEVAVPPEGATLETSSASSAYDALAGTTAAAEQSDRPGFERWAAELESVACWPMQAREVEALLSAVDPRRPVAREDVRDWCLGRVHPTPPALHGLFTRRGSAPEEESAIAYVIAHPDVGHRRVPRLGWGLCDLSGLTVLAQTRRKQGRVETLVSALVLAGEQGIDEAVCFEEVYGFEYEAVMHKGVFDVLIHRARDWAGAIGVLERVDGVVRLTRSAPVLLPDPRCTKPMQDRLLRTVAQQGGATARDIAKALGISLRMAQSTLSELAADGACQSRKEGRKVRYVVEDTTFSEPTQHG